MGWLTNTPEESAEIRGVADDALPDLSNEQLILLALARMYQGLGIDDDVMVEEMYRRGSETQPN